MTNICTILRHLQHTNIDILNLKKIKRLSTSTNVVLNDITDFHLIGQLQLCDPFLIHNAQLITK